MILSGTQPPSKREDIDLSKREDREEENAMSNTLALYVELDEKMLNDDGLLLDSPSSALASPHFKTDNHRYSSLSPAKSSMRNHTTSNVISPTNKQLFGGSGSGGGEVLKTPEKQLLVSPPKFTHRSMSMSNVEGLVGKLNSPMMPLPDFPRKKQADENEEIFVPYVKPPLSEEKAKYFTLKEKAQEKERLKALNDELLAQQQLTTTTAMTSRAPSNAPMSRSAQRRLKLDQAKEDERMKASMSGSNSDMKQSYNSGGGGDEKIFKSLLQREQDLDGFSVCSEDRNEGEGFDVYSPLTSPNQNKVSSRASSPMKRLLNDKQKALSSLSSQAEFVSPTKNNDTSS
jgi:hypothetical protein